MGVKVSDSEEEILKIFKNGMLMRLFGLRRGEPAREWRKLRHVEFHHLYTPFCMTKVT
jgi:hypothetical protein